MAESSVTPRPALTWGRFRSFVRLEHTLFSVPVLLGAAVLAARGWPPLDRLLVTLVAAAGARTAAMSLNRIVDRRLDALNPRTAGRELPAGRLSVAQAWGVTLAALAVYGAGAWYLSPVCAALAPVPVVVFCGYPYLKRVTPLAHFGVGLGLSLAPLGAYLAMRPEPLGALRGSAPLTLFTFFWVSGFDVIYATLDVESDRRLGLHSMPADWGAARALRVSAALHALAFAALAWLVLARFPHPAALALLAACGALLFLEHRNASDVDLAFFRFNAWLSFAVLALVLAGQFL
ncbi:MAG TPA: UbiA-like polyprenyltransferase [Candidatus Saccharimonadales bacterium]|nr:UbiA-like polyprenyltransferase [Candidatus Saccharimonadales bacterium]